MIVNLEPARVQTIASSMARAFASEPNFEFVLPDPARRAAVLPWIFGRSVAALAGRLGEAFTTEAGEGGAFWIAPGRKVGALDAIRAGMLEVPFRMGLGGASRFARLGARIDGMRLARVPQPHWYLMALGVDPSRQRLGVGGALLRPILDRADQTGVACYLETFAERNLAFYERHGFEVCAQDAVPDGPRFWGMIRRPGRA
ncbi:MAG TPA: GNAT family N-acetyltransferase [Vulgatibacter sp.]